MTESKVKALIVDSKDGFLKNIAELMEEYRNDNVQCMMLAYRRKDEASTRTYFIGADDPQMFKTLVRLEHDMLGLFDSEAATAFYEEDE